YSKCEFLSFNQDDLVTHMKTHTELIATKRGDKKEVLYVCQQCGKEFAGQKWLDNHIENAHSSSKIFVCDFSDCQYRTRFRCVMEDHKRRHLKAKDFKCTWEDCEAVF